MHAHSRTVPLAPLFLYLITLSGVTRAQDPTPSPVAPATGPVLAHRHLLLFAGEWEKQVSVEASPGTDPVTATGTMTNDLILGGRFLQMRQTTGVEALVILGFDDRVGKYTLHAIGSNGNFAVDARGEFREEDKSLILDGVDVDPAMRTQLPFRFVYRSTGTDSYERELLFQFEEGVWTRYVHDRCTRIASRK